MQADGRHRTEIVTKRVMGRTEFIARCDCGWHGRGLPTRRMAEEDADEHVRVT